MADKDVTEIREMLAAIRSDLASFRAAQEQICKAASCQRDGHHKTLYGDDGRGGLVQMVTSVDERLSVTEDRDDDTRDIPTRVQALEGKMSLVWGGVIALLLWAWNFLSGLLGAKLSN